MCVSGIFGVMLRTLPAWMGALVALLSITAPAHAVNLIINGDFEQSTYGYGGDILAGAPFAGPADFDGSYGVGNGVAGTQYAPDSGNHNIPWGVNQATGWTISGYNFLYKPGHADTSGAWNGFGPVKIAGPASSAPAANGMPATSPTGGYFLGADGAFDAGVNLAGPISQTVNGLIAGKKYTVQFYWAAGQQDGIQYDGATTEMWNVSLSGTTALGAAWSETQSTATWNNPVRGFKPWTQENFTFTAQSTTATLSFLAHGTPDGQPPFSLLDGVSLEAYVPEPQTWAMMIVGFGLIGGLQRSRRRNDQRAQRRQIV